jgi:DUF4097 and DUF4098 domain-containing protein YvlB
MFVFKSIFTSRQIHTRTETFTVARAASLHIRIPNGDVDVHTHTDSQEIRAVIKAHGRNAEAELAQVHVTFDEATATLHVTQPSRPVIAFSSIDIEIHAPSYEHISIHTAHGDSHIDAACNTLEVRSTAGDIKCTAACHTRMQLESTAGDIDVKHAAAHTDIRSTAGDVDVQVTQPAQVHVRTTAGDIDVEVARGFETQIDAQTLAGDIDNDIEITNTADGADTPAQVILNLEALSGDISIDRL